MAETLKTAAAVVGIDIGKNSFHVVGLDRRGAIVLRQKWSRGQVETRFANMSPCLIGMEACVGAHHLSRRLKALGHDARLMPAKYVRPYSKGQKNDFRDAEAIAEAVQRPTMKFVATETVDQLDLQALHRVRERLVGQHTGIINQIRAFLLDRGVAVRQGLRFLRTELSRILAAPSDVVSPRMVRIIEGLAGDWRRLDERILRVLFVQAAWAVLIKPKSWERHGFKSWLETARKRLHYNVLAIALANKLARIAWSILAHGRTFEASKIDEATAQTA
jgi:transposase